jgi:V/A-type H+-transporting ATPase subunit E
VSDKDHAARVSSGVEALIDRLRDEGVTAGRKEAQKIVKEAEARANWILKQAKDEAIQIKQAAQQQAAHYEKAGKEALNVAARDTLLALKTTLAGQFASEVGRLISAEMRKQELLKQMILEVVGRVKEDVTVDGHLEVLLPRDVMGLEQLSRDPEQLEQGKLTHFVRLVSADMLREGVSFRIADDIEGGIRLRLVDQDVTLELTDRAVASLILQHLQPRFRALIEGIVK